MQLINKMGVLVRVISVGLCGMLNVSAQSLEPRAYSNAPVGLNFVAVGYQRSEGGLIFDPSLDITEASSSVDVLITAYVRTLNVAGMSAKAGVVLPYADLYASGKIEGDFRSRKTSGLVDPSFYFSLNLLGAPALNLKDFFSYKQDMIVGFTLKITPPVGNYEKNKIINIGTNRWSIKPEFGLSKALNRWLFEGAVAATYYTDNDEFSGNKTREQDAVYSMQGHLTYTFKNKIWLSYGVTYFTGGETRIAGVVSNDLQDNSRTGFTAAIPINKYHSLKILASTGLSTRTGTDYDSISLLWQYRWGGGL